MLRRNKNTLQLGGQRVDSIHVAVQQTASRPHLNQLEPLMLNTEQFAATNKANFETLMGLTAKAFGGVEQLAALNLQVMRASLDDATETGLAVLSAQDPQSLFQLQATLLQPSVERATAYGKRAYGIVTGVAADVEKVAGEQAAAAQSTLVALIEAASKNGPEGSNSGVALFKSAIATANNALEGFQKAGRRAAETAEANYAAVTGSATKGSGKAKRG
jgi:phasin family protein